MVEGVTLRETAVFSKEHYKVLCPEFEGSLTW